MKKRCLVYSIFVFLSISLILPSWGENTEIKSALEYLKNYKFGMERAPLQPIIDAIKETKNDPKKQEELARDLADILSVASIDGKRFIARQLVVIGTPSIIPKVVPLLQDDDTIDIGCRILEQIPGELATDALIETLKNLHKDSLKIAIINALGRRKDEKSVDIISRYLDSENSGVRNSALWALSEIPGEKSAGAIWEWGRDKISSGDSVLIDSLLRTADRLVKDGGGESTRDLALSIYDSIYNDSNVDSILKVNALQGIVRLKGREVVSILERDILSGDKYLSTASVDMLKDKNLDEETVLKIITSVMPKVSPSLQLALLEVISARVLSSALPEVVSLVESQIPEVKLKAIKTLGKVGNVDSAELLMNLAISGDREVSETAEDALIKLSCDGIREFLVNKANQGSDLQRKLAVKLIGERRESEAKSLLLELIRKGDKVVLDESLDSLSIIGDESDLAFLFAQISKDVALGSKYVNAITSILGRVEDEGRRAKYVIDNFMSAKSVDEKKIYIGMLGDLKSPEGYEFLRSLLPNEADLAPVILRAMGKSEDVELLKYILSNLPSYTAVELRNAGVWSCLDILRSSVPLTELDKSSFYIELWKFADDNVNIQKNILGSISKLRRIESLDFIESIVPKDEIKNDWEVARINIAKNLCFAYPERCIPILEASLNVVKDKQKEEISLLLNGAKNRANFLTAWSVSGPYRLEDYSAERLFKEVSLPPEVEPSSVKDWRSLPMKVRGDGVIYGDLFEQLGEGVECVAYVACKIKCSKPSKATLLLGTNDGVKVWLNGKLIHSFPNGRIMTPDEDKVLLELQEDNVLLMAVYNQGGAWEFTAKLDGLDLNEIKIEPY